MEPATVPEEPGPSVVPVATAAEPPRPGLPRRAWRAVVAPAGTGPWTLRYSLQIVIAGAIGTLGTGAVAIAAGRYGWFASPGEPNGDGIRSALLTIAGAVGLTAGGFLAWGRLELSRAEGERAVEAQRLATRSQDAAEAGQRTDRYTRAVEQLGHPDLAVRLGALYALEALARDSVADRTAICEVICAYARHHSVDRTGPEPVPVDGTAEDYRAAITIALRLPLEWDLPFRNLAGTVITNIDLSDRAIPSVNFERATFTGPVRFDRSTFTGTTSFHKATFGGWASFLKATYCADVSFTAAVFHDGAKFDDSTFLGPAYFVGTDFRSLALFGRASFEHVEFTGARFAETTFFVNSHFGEGVTDKTFMLVQVATELMLPEGADPGRWLRQDGDEQLGWTSAQPYEQAKPDGQDAGLSVMPEGGHQSS